jgi:hypothetical protein
MFWMIELYLAICLIGLALLIIFAALGGFGAGAEGGDVGLDAGHDIDAGVDAGMDGDLDVGTEPGTGLSPLSLPIILVFMTAFGAFGMILEVIEINWLYVPFLAGIGGVVIGGAMFFVMLKVFSVIESSSVVPLKKLVGMKANVSVPIKKGGEGQIVVVRSETGRMLVGAISDTNIPNDSIVEITEVMGDVVRVKPIKKGRNKTRIK